MSKEIKVDTKRICSECVGWCCYRFWCGEWDDLLESWKDFPEDVKFFKENFRVISREKAPHEDIYYVRYTCKAYDAKKGTCTRHEDRPQICRNFVCWNAKAGCIPDRRDFPAQARAMRRAGIKPNCPDGRKNPRKKSISPRSLNG